MKLIVAVDKNFGIGYKNNLLTKNPIDMKFFKEMTNNNIVVMGRKTFESFPNQEPLPNRINVIITRNKSFYKENCIIFNSIEDFIKSKYFTKNTYVIGGEKIYTQLIDYCDDLYITKMENSFICDTYFPANKLDNFILKQESELLNYKDICFKFLKYERRK